MYSEVSIATYHLYDGGYIFFYRKNDNNSSIPGEVFARIEQDTLTFPKNEFMLGTTSIEVIYNLMSKCKISCCDIFYPEIKEKYLVPDEIAIMSYKQYFAKTQYLIAALSSL